MSTSPPVVLLHGFASSFDHGWGRGGWPEILADLSRSVVRAELLGHGDSERPHDPTRYASVAEHVLMQLPDEAVDAVGFSAGAITLLRLAAEHPSRFRRLVLLGVGDNLLEREPNPGVLIDALSPEALATSADGNSLLRRLVGANRNDKQALTAFIQGFPSMLEESSLSAVAMPTLVVVGDQDRAHPAARLVGALAAGELLVVPGLDHFATPSDFRAIDAALTFIEA